jgi:hypothetical protein
MTDQEINKVIAEFCGKKVISLPFIPREIVVDKNTFFTKEAAAQWRLVYPTGASVKVIPNYCEDLNVMQEVENATFGNSILWVEFMERLCDATGAVNTSMVDAMVIIIQATARQRAEAFLKTVKLDSPQETL